MISAIYTDGGCAYKNPSPYGISWAFVVVDDSDTVVYENSGTVLTADCKGYKASNNLAEMIAVVKALEWLRLQIATSVASTVKIAVKICSDSEITIGRAFQKWSMKKLPANVANRLGTAIAGIEAHGVRLVPVLLAGHPTKTDLEAGFKMKKGKKFPVSIHNKKADELCWRKAQQLIKE